MFRNIAMKKLFFLNGGSVSFPLTPRQILLLFLAVSFAITAIDVAMAHSQNNFTPKYEWIPIFYSITAAAATFLYTVKPNYKQIICFYKLTMMSGIIMGLGGMFFHIFGNMNVRADSITDWLVFGSPVFAPIAFTGMSLYGLALIDATGRQLMRLVALGFFVVGLTAGFDHAQTHFESVFTLFPLIAGFFGCIVTWLTTNQINEHSNINKISLPVANFYYAAMIMMIITGMTGFYLHLAADLENTVRFSWERLLYHAPVLAPLLFAQLGTLGILSSLTTSPAISPCMTKLSISKK